MSGYCLFFTSKLSWLTLKLKKKLPSSLLWNFILKMYIKILLKVISHLNFTPFEIELLVQSWGSQQWKLLFKHRSWFADNLASYYPVFLQKLIYRHNSKHICYLYPILNWVGELNHRFKIIWSFQNYLLHVSAM